MAIEPLGSMMTIQSQSVQKTVDSKEVTENKEVSNHMQTAVIDATTMTVNKVEGKEGKEGQSAGDSAKEQQQAANEKIKKAVEQLNKTMPHSEAIFGIHDETNRVTIKIVDKSTKEVIREFPPEKTLDMIAKVWELAGILVDEKR